MAHLIKSYPSQPHKNIEMFSGDLSSTKSYLDKIEESLRRRQLSKCGTMFIEIARFDDFTLNTCIYKNIDTEDEETMDENYSIVF